MVAINYSKIVNNQAMLHKTRIITRKPIPIYQGFDYDIHKIYYKIIFFDRLKDIFQNVQKEVF